MVFSGGAGAPCAGVGSPITVTVPSGAITSRAGSLAGIMPSSRARAASSGAESAASTSRCNAARSSVSLRLSCLASLSW
ncbi:Uncharacterised protein [Mycobacteroides abscessus subsp. abscessus]|nr:Uncharacterised protein [Mycobacteroides abscessus subsp. abscessus]